MIISINEHYVGHGEVFSNLHACLPEIQKVHQTSFWPPLLLFMTLCISIHVTKGQGRRQVYKKLLVTTGVLVQIPSV